MAPILYDTHMHTPLCKHAVGEPGEYAAVAEERGLKGITVTCHNPDPNGWSPRVRMAIEEFDEYCDLVARTRESWAGRIDVLLGIESDFAPGMEPWLEELHARAPFHYVLGSVHPHLRQYKERFFDGDIPAFQRVYFDHLAEAAETGLFDCISHPDLVKNDFPRDWDAETVIDDVRRTLDRIARTGVAMELNTSGLLKSIPEMNPGGLILGEMRRRGIPVVVGSDAHRPERVGADFERAFEELERAGYSHVNFFIDRERREVPIAAARASLSLGE